MSFEIVNSASQWLVILLNLLLTIALIRRLNQMVSSASPFDDDEDMGLDKGSPAPDFEAETLTGETVSLANYVGKAVSLIFVSTGCTPCLETFPALNAFATKAKKAGLEVLLVNTDENRPKLIDLVQSHSISLPVVIAPMESNPLASDYKANGVPFYCLLNPESCVESTGFLDAGWEKQIIQAWTAA